VRGYYVHEFDRRLNALMGIQQGQGERAFRPGQTRFVKRDFQRGKGKGDRRSYRDMAAAVPDPALSQNRLARAARRGLKEDPGAVREELIVLTLLRHPWLIESHYDTIEGLAFQNKALLAVTRALLELSAEGKTLDKVSVCDHLAPRGLEGIVAGLESKESHNLGFSRADAPPEEVRDGFAHALARHEKETILKEELRQATTAWSADPTSENMARMRELQLRLTKSSGEEIGFRETAGPSHSPNT
jgi:DNA primase